MGEGDRRGELEGDVATVRGQRDHTAGFADGGRGCEPRSVGRSWKRLGNGFIPDPPKRTQPYWHLDFGLVRPVSGF